MNAHVGESSDGFGGSDRGRGFERRNQESDRLLELAEAMNLVALNTQFEKRRSHLVTCKSEQDVLVRKEDKKTIMDCKAIPNKSVVAQHKLVVADFVESNKEKKSPSQEQEDQNLEAEGGEGKRVQKESGKSQRREICEWNVRIA
ncbi:uncharacterized protein [Macrobrachium rosenbergii]|uniref:uncharacterized protein n=1 Tax=Macrobrachium rosenbergii TaxID=79674 RepID=UPI0034D5420B